MSSADCERSFLVTEKDCYRLQKKPGTFSRTRFNVFQQYQILLNSHPRQDFNPINSVFNRYYSPWKCSWVTTELLHKIYDARNMDLFKRRSLLFFKKIKLTFFIKCLPIFCHNDMYSVLIVCRTLCRNRVGDSGILWKAQGEYKIDKHQGMVCGMC